MAQAGQPARAGERLRAVRLAEGRTNAEVAERLLVSPPLTEFEVKDRGAAVAEGFRDGLLRRGATTRRTAHRSCTTIAVVDLPDWPDLDASLDHVRGAPADAGTLELIVRRPAEDAREVLDEGRLDLAVGLVGDNWPVRPSIRTADGSPHPDMQLNVIAARALALVCPDRDRWALAGDQLVVDLDLTEENLPPGTRLAIGDAVIEVTDQPHRGCVKFSQRFGADALRLVNSEVGRALRLRGVNAKVVQPGTIRRGDTVTKR